ncbi:hypothetical protein NRF55_003200 [Acinetobacter baumannii]|uniref:hypothetical protein n=3 Tax=Acinetobacter baumannii TaxID=470 RepID=UPI002019DB4C|nr:hypothetical protein [Acinetobacter baumannii]ELS4602069.1 hypothetical protein [Acinetobacter baumannii]MDC4811006.1 hypothetical protein [Acinetobacter baumannii]
MKKKMKFLISFFTTFFLLPTLAFPATNYNQDVTGTIERIYLNGDIYFFRLNGNDTCAKKTNGYNEYYIFNVSQPHAKSWYALILTAAQNRKPITVRVKTDCKIDAQKEIMYIFQDYT